VLIADDHLLVRDGLRSLLEAHGTDVVGEARDGNEAVELARSLRPDLVLMDLAMPGMDGLSATRLIAAELPEVKVVALTASEEESDLFEALRAGAQGYVPKNIEPERFFALLDAAARGEPALPPALASKVLSEFARPSSPPKPERRAHDLTQRELEIVRLLVEGVTANRELAGRLVVTESTIKYHLHNILGKLGLDNRAQLVAYALRHGLVDLRRDS
jgi:DNA-binding NarL/FixJ family response regulator